MHRFYYPHPDFKSDVTITDPDEIHHIKKVLRLKPGANVSLFNNQNEAQGVITIIDEASITIEIKSVSTQPKESSLLLTLACAMPKKGKFEWIIEKCTELGINEIVPLQTKRSEIKFDDKRMQTKLKRFETVALNAAKQSQRVTIPTIHPMMNFKNMLEFTCDSIQLVGSLEQGSQPLFATLQSLKEPKKVTLIIGPEGDFTPNEYAMTRSFDCKPVSLGNTVLKVETAAIAAVCFTRLFFLNID